METRDKPYLTDVKKELSEYLELRLEVLKLSAYEKTARVSSSTASVLVLIFLGLFFLLFLFVTLGFYLAKVTGSYTTGFGIISVFYFVLLLVFVAIRKKVFEKFLANKIVEALTEDEEAVS